MMIEKCCRKSVSLSLGVVLSARDAVSSQTDFFAIQLLRFLLSTQVDMASGILRI